jgi:hypothetical protein
MSIIEVLEAARRLHIATVAWAGFLLALTFGALAFGRVPWLFPGFVEHTELNQIIDAASQTRQAILNQQKTEQSDIVFLKKESIESAIRAKISIRCMTSDKAFKSNLSEEIQRLEDQYFSLTGQGYRQPNCDEI